MTSILTGAQVKTMRQGMGLTQSEFAVLLGYTGRLRKMLIYKIESGRRPIDYLRANLLLAIEQGYEPVGFAAEPDEEDLTQRQAEALWAAKNHGRADTLYTTERGSGGGFRRMLREMREQGLLTSTLGPTDYGLELLADWESTRTLKPRLKRHA